MRARTWINIKWYQCPVQFRQCGNARHQSELRICFDCTVWNRLKPSWLGHRSFEAAVPNSFNVSVLRYHGVPRPHILTGTQRRESNWIRQQRVCQIAWSYWVEVLWKSRSSCLRKQFCTAHVGWHSGSLLQAFHLLSDLHDFGTPVFLSKLWGGKDIEVSRGGGKYGVERRMGWGKSLNKTR